MTGRFITFEGIDGAGKSTYLNDCAAWLRAQGMTVIVSREPGGTPLAEAIRGWFLEHASDARTEALLAFAGRSDHLSRVIRPALARGDWVVCDRFTDSTVAYQGGGRGLGVEAIEQLEAWLHGDLRPDLTFFFDLEPHEAARRRSRARAADRFEAEDVHFFGRVREAYRHRASADPTRVVMIDASGDPSRIRRELNQALDASRSRWSNDVR